MSSDSIYYVREKNCYQLDFVLKDEDDNRIFLAALNTLQCTLYYYNPELTTGDKYHLATINGRYNQNVININDVTVSTTGTVSWSVQEEDTAKLNTNEGVELHTALFQWSWDTPSKQNSQEVNFYVKHVPYAT